MEKIFAARRWLWGLVALGALAALGLLWATASRAALPPPSERLLSAARGLDEIVIEAELLPETRTLEVRQKLTLTSQAEKGRGELVLRTWPNAFQSVDTSPCGLEESYDSYYPEGFSAGALVMREARVGMGAGESRAVQYRYTDAAKTVLSVLLPESWEPGAAISVTLRYDVTIPRAAYRFGVMDGYWALGNVFAIPAVWEDGAYRADPYYPIGDPFLSDPANYTVSLTVPPGFVCAASGYAVEERAGEKNVYRFSAPAVRDFALTVSDRYRVAQAMEGDVLVSVYAADAGKAKEALGYARNALKIFAQRYGPYPYQSLSIGETAFPHGGMEYPAMAMLGADTLKAGGQALEYAVAHEIAHQWWYAVVGSDQVNQPWQDEALCEFSVLIYEEARYGRARRDELYASRVGPSMRVAMPEEVTPGAPLSYFSSMGQYTVLVYERGAAMLCALDDMMNGGLDEFLRVYYDRYAFQRTTRQDFEALLRQHTGEDYEPMMTDYLDVRIVP